MSLDGMKTKADRVDANFCPEIPHYNTTIPYWRGTRRFQVVNHQATPRTKVRHGDLGKGAALEEFAKWALGSFPAEHYMLVLSSHGDGSPHFLNFLSRRKTTRQSGKLTLRASARYRAMEPDVDSDSTGHDDGAGISLYKTRGKHILFNAEIRERLKKVLGGNKFDVIGFDACYKNMIETAFAMSDIGRVMVASEEPEPDTGWDYSDWLSKVSPDAMPIDVGKGVVESYRFTYQIKPIPATQAAIDLSNTSTAVDNLDRLAIELFNHSELWDSVGRARDCVKEYQYRQIDLAAFLDKLIAELTRDGRGSARETASLAQDLRKTLTAQLIVHPAYASALSVKAHQSHGMALYFPSSNKSYRCDPDYKFYDPDGRHAISFFREHAWGKFLKAFLATRGVANCR
jgi:hypothetical protein